MRWTVIAVFIDFKVELMVRFSVVEAQEGFDFRHYSIIGKPFFLDETLQVAGDLLLFRCGVVDAAPILCANVVRSLFIEGRWVVDVEEEVCEITVCNVFRDV